VGDRKVRGRKGVGLTNLLGGVAKCCVCGASMRLIRKGSNNDYLYLRCSAALRGKCEHRKWHRYRQIEAVAQLFLADIAYGNPLPDDKQTALRAEIAHAKRDAAEVERRLAALESRHSAKMAKIAELEEQLRRHGQIGEQVMTVRRLIKTQHRLPAEERLAIRSRINAGLRRCIRGGLLISPDGNIEIRLSAPGGRRPYREIHLVPTVPDGASRLETVEEIMAAVKAGHRVGMAPPVGLYHDLGLLLKASK
jgi:uncharacterized coiled-coil protein SlyX